jgi:TRAP transporter TAXI family solute receptor
MPQLPVRVFRQTMVANGMHAQSGLSYFATCRLFALLLGVLASGMAVEARAAERDTVVIGAGAVAGVYFPVAGAICRVVNSARTGDDATCVVVPGTGSKASLAALRAGRLDFAIVQSDWQFWAHSGAEFFVDPTPFTSLNGVFALHAEPLVIAVRRDGDIAALTDLKDKRVGVGSPASAARGMMEDLLSSLGWSMSDFTEVHELTPRQQTAALCGNTIDAAVYAVGSPSATLAALTARCDVSVVPLTGPPIDSLLADKTFYRKTAIPAGLYSGVATAVPTFGVGATLVTRAEVPDAVVTEVVAAVFENIETFRSLHPALTWLDAEQMAADGITAPLHPAVVRYFANRQGS